MLEYNTDIFEAESMRRLGGHLVNLLGGVVAEPQRRISELPLLSLGERRQSSRSGTGRAMSMSGRATSMSCSRSRWRERRRRWRCSMKTSN